MHSKYPTKILFTTCPKCFSNCFFLITLMSLFTLHLIDFIISVICTLMFQAFTDELKHWRWYFKINYISNPYFSISFFIFFWQWDCILHKEYIQSLRIWPKLGNWVGRKVGGKKKKVYVLYVYFYKFLCKLVSMTFNIFISCFLVVNYLFKSWRCRLAMEWYIWQLNGLLFPPCCVT